MPDQVRGARGGALCAGYTLIELMIAIGLGSAIVLTASASMRLAAQAVTIAERMSRNNELLASGISQALDEVDYWKEYDDPQGGAGMQRLRASEAPPGITSATGHALLFGLPFSPFSPSAANGQSSGSGGATRDSAMAGRTTSGCGRSRLTMN